MTDAYCPTGRHGVRDCPLPVRTRDRTGDSALRSKFKSPKDVLRCLGLDEGLLEREMAMRMNQGRRLGRDEGTNSSRNCTN
jgi:hypothetical protein